MTDLTPVLSELREIRRESSDNHEQTIQRLTALETHVYNLVGNGQPGKVQLLDERLQLVEADMNQNAGRKSLWVSFVALIGVAAEFLLRKHS